MVKKRVLLLICFGLILILGLFLVFRSVDLAETMSRQSFGDSSIYTVSDSDITRGMVTLIAVGCVVSLLAGYGLIKTLLKD